MSVSETTADDNTEKSKTSANPNQQSVDPLKDPELFWSAPKLDNRKCLPPTYDNSFDSPYLVLMESELPNVNLGRLDPNAIGKFIANVVDGSRKKYISGLNQIKIFCNKIEDVNYLYS